MQQQNYQVWLEQQGYPKNTIRNRINNARRVEEHYGDLDTAFDQDDLVELTALFEYSMNDTRRQRPNPTKIPVDGDIRTNLSMYKNAIRLYRQFRQETATNWQPPATQEIAPPAAAPVPKVRSMRDSYERFFSRGHVTKEQFFEFGLEETIYAPVDAATKAWQNLKARIDEDQQTFIRGFGRDAGGTMFFLKFYESVLGKKNIERDPTNNEHPRRVITSLTGYSKSATIRNYQISHIFGRTKNVYAFTAPWNIAFVPKILDPFTGHEAKGDMIDEYQALFRQQAFEQFQPMIDEFNEIVTNPRLCEGIKNYINQMVNDNPAINKKVAVKLEKALLEQFEPISPRMDNVK